MEKELEKPYLTNCNLLISQNLWSVHYQIMFIILLKEIIKLNANMGMVIKNVKRVVLNTKYPGVIFNTQTLKMIQYNTNAAIEIVRKSLMKT